MSVEQLEQLKQQISALSAEEKADLQRFLATLNVSHSTAQASSVNTLNDQRQRRQVWLNKHRQQYGGLYVAFDGEKLLGTGRSYPEAHAIAKQAGVINAYIDFVPPLDHIGELTGWN